MCIEQPIHTTLPAAEPTRPDQRPALVALHRPLHLAAIGALLSHDPLCIGHQSNCQHNALKDDFHVFPPATALDPGPNPVSPEWSNAPNDAQRCSPQSCCLNRVYWHLDGSIAPILNEMIQPLHHQLFGFMSHSEYCDKQAKLNWSLWLATPDCGLRTP